MKLPGSRFRLGWLCIGLVLLTSLNACSGGSPAAGLTTKPIIPEEPQITPSPTAVVMRRPATLQIGLNGVPFFGPVEPGKAPDTETAGFQPEHIFKDFSSLGVQAFSAPQRADLSWSVVEPRQNQWDFAAADSVLTNPEFEPVVTLFERQYASPNPPWQTDPARFQKVMGAEAREYIKTVVTRYARFVRYYELGHEMDHWRYADPDYVPAANDPAGPTVKPKDGFTPQEQGRFLAEAAALIKQYDPDAVIILPSLSQLDEESFRWLAGVAVGSGKDWFDIIAYQYYSSWEQYDQDRNNFQDFLKSVGLEQKTIWLTATGSTSLESFTLHTKYPNSEESQAADVIRRMTAAYGHGDAYAAWHTYISLKDTQPDAWQMFGLRGQGGEQSLAYQAYKMLAYELLPFSKVDLLSAQPKGVHAYRVHLRSGRVKYIAWGSGSFTIPAEMSQQTVMIPLSYGQLDWQTARTGMTVRLSVYPVLLK